MHLLAKTEILGHISSWVEPVLYVVLMKLIVSCSSMYENHGVGAYKNIIGCLVHKDIMSCFISG